MVLPESFMEGQLPLFVETTGPTTKPPGYRKLQVHPMQPYFIYDNMHFRCDSGCLPHTRGPTLGHEWIGLSLHSTRLLSARNEAEQWRVLAASVTTNLPDKTSTIQAQN